MQHRAKSGFPVSAALVGHHLRRPLHLLVADEVASSISGTSVIDVDKDFGDLCCQDYL